MMMFRENRKRNVLTRAQNVSMCMSVVITMTIAKIQSQVGYVNGIPSLTLSLLFPSLFLKFCRTQHETAKRMIDG